MVRALITTAIAAIVCAILSCWLVLIGWSLMGDAVSHAVLPGVVIAYIVGSILSIVVVGILVLIAAYVLNIVFSIIAAVKANRGEWYQYPLTIKFLS